MKDRSIGSINKFQLDGTGKAALGSQASPMGKSFGTTCERFALQLSKVDLHCQ